VIPGNDDALRAIRLFASRIAEAVIAGRDMKQSVDAEATRDGGDDTPQSGAGGEDFRRGRQVRRPREAAPASA
jgi:small subunit ribosomal protein S2